MSHSQLIWFSFLLITLILFSAFFSCAETALMSANRYRLRHKARLKKRYAIRLLHLFKRPDRLLGAILIGNTFANILASSLATLIAYHFYGDHGALIAAVILTFVILIFAEITPKTFAALYPDQVSRWVVYPIQFLLQILYPLVFLANSIANALLRLLRIRVKDYTIEPLSREELKSILYDATAKTSRQYQNMLLGILDLTRLTVDDVMVSRHKILGIDLEQPWEKIVEDLQLLKQDWVVVYRGNVNQTIGVLFARDVFRFLVMQKHFNKDILQQCIHEPYFVPEGTSLQIQLKYFQKHADQVAFIVDEYGEVKGLVTLNDILEEIVGDFSTSIPVEKRIVKQEDNSYFVDGAMTIREFNRVTEFELPLSGPRTINGLIVEHLEALPRAGTCIMIAKYPIEIVQVKENRVKLARVFTRLH